MGIDDLIRMLKSTNTVQPGLVDGTGSGPQSELLAVLRQAAGGTPCVPPGWARLQRDAERMLRTAASTVASRRELRVTDIYVLGSQPVVRLSNHDPVVHGIYRRTLARARHTCQACGRAGRTWSCLSQFQVVCARCAAPYAVAADLDALEELRDRQRRAGRDAVVAEIPPRLANTIALVLRDAEDYGTGDDFLRTSAARPLTRDEFDPWCSWLLELRDNPKFAEALALVR